MTTEQRVTINKLPTGVPGLDEIVGGGFPEYSFNIIAGAPGSGKLVPEAHVVEAFLNIFAGILHSDSVLFGSDKPSVFYCGEDRDAKTVVAQLIGDVGFEPVDAGPLSNARFVEPASMLLLQLGAFLGMAKEWKPGEFTDLSIKLLRR